MSLVDRERSPEPVSGQERALEIRLGGLGGVELRPTRLFLWKGSERDGNERLVQLGERPAALDYERAETTTRAGSVEMRSVGNPLLTIALAGVIALRRWADAPDEDAPGRPPTEPPPS